MDSGEADPKGRSPPEPAGERGMFLPRAVAFAATRPALPPPALAGRPSAPPDAMRLPLAKQTLRLTGPALLSIALGPRALRRAWSTELDRGLAFILAPAFLAAGAIVYYSLAREPGLVPLLVPTLLAAVLFAATRSRPAVHLALGAATLCLAGALLAKAETMRARTKMLGAEIATVVTGRVTGIERMASGRIRLTVDVISTARPVLRHAPDRVRVSARNVPDGVAAGSVVSGLVRLLPPAGPVRPGSYDFSFRSYFDGIGAGGFYLRGPEIIGEADPAAGFDASVQRLRHTMADRIRGRIGGAEGEIAAALVVGVRAGIPDDVSEALRRAGIYHIISISGLHMALVAGAIMGVLRFGFALFPNFSSRHPVKKYTAALAMGGLAAYLFISGGEVAAQRSFLMLAVMLIAVLFDRAALTLRNLAISAIVVILVSPHEVVGPSFQMSFAATAALVGAYSMWSDYRAGRPKRPRGSRSIPAWLAARFLAAVVGIAVTSLVAGGATAIYSAWHFQQLPSLGLLTNLATMPIVSVVMLLAVLGTALMPFGLDGIFFDGMGLGLSATVAIARWFSERAPLGMIGPVPAAAVIAVTAAILVATVTTTRLRIAAAPIAAVGLVILALRPPPPDLLVSEDARLLGLAIGEARMAVNRLRPSEFTAENWQRTLAAVTVLTPVRTAGDAGVAALQAPNAGSAGFACSETLCIGKHPSGAIVAHAANAGSAVDACGAASVIVIDDATAARPCENGTALVISARDLARRGSASVSFVEDLAPRRQGAAGIGARIEYAISQPYRPWHEHRRYSRAARGLPDYERTRKQNERAPQPPHAPSDTGRPARSPGLASGPDHSFNTAE